MSDALLTRIAEALEHLVRLHPANQPDKANDPKPAKVSKPPKESKPDPTPAAGATTAVSPAPATTASPAGTGSADAGDIMAQAANAVINLANNFSRDSAIEAMAKFGAKKVSQITDPAQLAALLADVNARIADETAKKANASLI